MKPALALAASACGMRASMYLPVVLIVLLALGTWWLARNTPVFSTPAPEQAVKHEPDYFMRNFAVKNFDAAGLLQSEVAGAEGRHFPDTDVLEIDSARIRSFKNGQLTTATANRAYSNGDGSEVQLVGNAVVVREPVAPCGSGATPRMEFRGEFLHAFLNTEQVNSHKPVTMTRGSDQFVADCAAVRQFVSGWRCCKAASRALLTPRSNTASNLLVNAHMNTHLWFLSLGRPAASARPGLAVLPGGLPPGVGSAAHHRGGKMGHSPKHQRKQLRYL